MTQKKQINTRLPILLINRIQIEAAKRGIKVCNLIEIALVKELRKEKSK